MPSHRNPAIAVLLAILLLGSSCATVPVPTDPPPRIVDLHSSIVLDGGSYTVDLFFAGDSPPLHLFVPNPTERPTARLQIKVVTISAGRAKFAALDAKSKRRLLLQLKTAAAGKVLADEARMACAMLVRVLEHPYTPWDEVHFPELWGLDN